VAVTDWRSGGNFCAADPAISFFCKADFMRCPLIATGVPLDGGGGAKGGGRSPSRANSAPGGTIAGAGVEIGSEASNPAILTGTAAGS
jgi:hypothetical protein